MWFQVFALRNALKPSAFEKLSFDISKVLFIPWLEWNLTWLFHTQKPTQTKEEWVPPPPLLFSLRHCSQ